MHPFGGHTMTMRKRTGQREIWLETHIGETLSFYRLTRAHREHLKSTSMLERLNEAFKLHTLT
jgi:transposase-like protein